MSDGDVTLARVIPFGKYKGQPVEVLRSDSGYVDWLMAQDWVREKYPQFVQVIVNNFAAPTETPEHNALQAKFLDPAFRARLLRRYFSHSYWRKESLTRAEDHGVPLTKAQEYLAEKSVTDLLTIDVEFEYFGWDVVLRTTKRPKVPYWVVELADTYVELKTTLGDDYPAVLRQMHANRNGLRQRNLNQWNEAQRSRPISYREPYPGDDPAAWLLVVDSFTATGASYEQVGQIFWASHFALYQFSEFTK